MLRRMRHWVIAQATQAAMQMAPRLSTRALERIGRFAGQCGPYCPIVGPNVAANMRALGVYSAAAHREYFRQIGRHLAGVLHAFRCAKLSHRDGDDSKLWAIAAHHIELDNSIEQVRREAGRRQGVILVGPHIVNYLLSLTRLNHEIPLTVYLRYSKDPARQAAKQRWLEASGVEWVYKPAQAPERGWSLARIARALREGRVLFITPDLPQKRGRGTPVHFFGREIYLPAGPGILALRTGAPLFILTAQLCGPRQRLTVYGPLDRRLAPADSTNRQAASELYVQRFADCLERFLVEQTPLWYLWGDKRWTRLLHGDPQYVRWPANGGRLAGPTEAT